MSKVFAKDFHPMRGHVGHGQVVCFSDGRELTIKSSGNGWALFDGDEQVSERADGATHLTEIVVALEVA